MILIIVIEMCVTYSFVKMKKYLIKINNITIIYIMWRDIILARERFKI
jgi:hypothetical protein